MIVARELLDVVDVYDNNNILFSLELTTIDVLSSLGRLVMNWWVHIEAVETTSFQRATSK